MHEAAEFDSTASQSFGYQPPWVGMGVRVAVA